MKIDSISPVSMVAINDVEKADWKNKKETPINFQQLLESVVEKDKPKASGRQSIRLVTNEKGSKVGYVTALNTKTDDSTNQTGSVSNTSSVESAYKYSASAANGSYNPETVYDNYFKQASEKYGVSVDLLKSVAKVESDFHPTVVSSSGAVGLMQLMPETARTMGVSDSYDPQQNIMGGAKYLSILLDEFDGDVNRALAGYNAGAGAVKRAGGVPSYTQDYVDKVLGYYLG